MSYSLLQNISSYSLLQSTNTLPKLVNTAKDKGYTALALTDKNVMYGAVAFYKEASKHGIKPIIGLTLSIQGTFLSEHSFDLVLLAKDQLGYQNLMRLSTLTMTNDSPLKLEQVGKLLHHLFVLLPETSEASSLVTYDRSDDAFTYINELKRLVDDNAVKLGITDDFENNQFQQKKELSQNTQIDLVALNPVSYLKAHDYFNTKVLKAIEAGTVLNNISEQKNDLGHDWLRTQKETEARYLNHDLESALNVNEEIVESCNVTIPKEQPQLPHFENPNHESSDEYLRELCENGLKKIIKQHPEQKIEYQDRLKHELDVINRMGFDDYFLIVWDVVNFAHIHHILTGPGRGSAAGSLVAYCLKITDVDPIEYDLLFERFLNEERAQMPDIDLDIPDDKRDEVLQYVHEKYGNDRVAQIITFGTLGAKQSIRDVGRVFGMTPSEMSEWSKAIPNHLHETLNKAFQESQKLKNIVADQKINQTLFETASEIEGLPRHYSTHAAGLILSDKPIVEKAPLQSGNDGLLMTQYSKYYVEDVGLLKIDFLGLRNLSIMANILQTIKKQGKLDFSISEINLNDPKTLKLFQDGKTDGVFQFESSGIKSVLKRMHPDNFNLIAAVNALYRPGPMENIDTFIARKNGKEKVDYQNDAIKKILGSTYGIIVYQEQVMQLAATMGGFSLGQADVLRRAMSKKHRNEMDSMRERFINGSITNGYSKETAETTFEYIERFASYGFNKSHAIAYSKMAFELAYLKAHFPGPFFAALLNSVLGNKNKIKNYVQEAKDNQIKVLTPDINYSNPEFVYQNESIKFGFNAVKGLRSDFIKELIRIRKSSGLFTSLSDFINRMEKKFRKEDQIKALIYAGAFDNFGYNRRELIEALPGLINSAELSGSLLESIPGLEVNIKRKADFLDWEKINFENEYLGTFLSGHPVERYNDLKEQKHTYRINELHDGQKHVSAILLISHIKVIRTKKGQLMAFIDGSDQFGTVDITIFPQLYAQIGQSLKQNMVVLVQGNVEKRRELQIIADSIQPAANVVHQIENNRSVKNKKLFLQISEELDNKTVYEKMKNIFVENHGKTPIILYRKKSRKKQILDHKFNIALNPKLIKELSDLLGKDNVVTR